MNNHKLIIAEKPSVGTSIAAALNVKERGKGFLYGNGYIVTWVFGHLLNLADFEVYDGKYKKWVLDHLPIIPDEWQYTVVPDKKEQLKIITDLMKRSDVDEIICATDAGREGELIFREVYHYCNCKKPMKRLWVNSLEESAIINGFKNLHDGSEYDNLYKAALCRQTADWLVGCNFSRVFSLIYGNGVTLNIGRVQSPTLALIVNRENQIAEFVKEPFYTVEIDCGDFTANSEKMKYKSVAENIREICDRKSARVISIESQKKSNNPPLLYDLTMLQREANRLYGLTSAQTLDIAQSLYEHKYISYPRTDSRYLPDDMAGILPGLVHDVAEVLKIKNIKIADISRVINNSKITDHHAIIPTHTMTVSNLSELSDNEQNILEMIALKLLCSVSESHVYNEVAITIGCENNIFTAKGQTVINKGWKSLIQNDGENDEKTLPELSQGYEFPSVLAKLNEGFTSPPRRFTEDTLLLAMETAGDFSSTPDAERKGLGTPATRAAMIESLLKYRFIERKQAEKIKYIVPTAKGANIVKILPDIIKSADLTADWEHKFKKIEKGELSDVDFMAEIIECTQNVVNFTKAANPKYTGLFSSYTAIGTCPRCGKTVRDYYSAFKCEIHECGFAIFKNNKFFVSRRTELTAKIVSEILKNGRVKINGLYSERTNTTYDSFVIYEDTGKYVNFYTEKKNIK